MGVPYIYRSLTIVAFWLTRVFTLISDNETTQHT
jgi:hypothetical protein